MKGGQRGKTGKQIQKYAPQKPGNGSSFRRTWHRSHTYCHMIQVISPQGSMGIGILHMKQGEYQEEICP